MEPDATTMSTDTYNKHFIPLESNPEVFTELIHKLGVSESLEFQDVLSLDDPEVLGFLPQPVYALCLVFPTTEEYDERVLEEDAVEEQHEAGNEDRNVVFYKQTINNACGLYAILHAVCNGEARTKLISDSILDKLLRTAALPDVDQLTRALESDSGLEQAYAEVAMKGDTEAPESAEDEVDYHYICFVKSHENGHLYQLDGVRTRPIDIGALAADEGVLSDKCLDVIRSMMANADGNVNFSLMALVAVDG
ncbi:ubiquitin carboxyl-terminal hydrolase, family 1 [Phaeosphaeriaceae sp. PMI808]|nr:ubiquitin carboxyl-terminal hydrolase, family 1 [Phaeosphaeriaceae sp. PMI808]